MRLLGETEACRQRGSEGAAASLAKTPPISAYSGQQRGSLSLPGGGGRSARSGVQKLQSAAPLLHEESPKTRVHPTQPSDQQTRDPCANKPRTRLVCDKAAHPHSHKTAVSYFYREQTRIYTQKGNRIQCQMRSYNKSKCIVPPWWGGG